MVTLRPVLTLDDETKQAEDRQDVVLVPLRPVLEFMYQYFCLPAQF